jgi:hypothetical protein
VPFAPGGRGHGAQGPADALSWPYYSRPIPISAVIRVDDGIRLNISKQQVQDLPPVDVDHLTG